MMARASGAGRVRAGPAVAYLLNDQLVPREEFSFGETIYVAGRGLPPCAVVTMTLASVRRADTALLLARYQTDRHGAMPPATLISHVGLFDERGGCVSVRDTEARQRWANRAHSIELAGAGRARNLRVQLPFSVYERDRIPRIFCTTPEGHLQTSLKQADQWVGVTLQGFPSGCVRVIAVRRQFGWRAGDPLEPALDRHLRPLATTVRTDGEAAHYVRVARAGDLQPGAYQFIVRPFHPGSFDVDDPVLHLTDVVSDRRDASLVIRRDLRERPWGDNGVFLTPQIAGRPLAHRPYFQFVNNFPKGTDVYAALDPDALPTGLVGQRAAIYVIAHKSAGEWSASTALNDVSGPGMTAAPKIVPIVPGCVNWNTTLVWPNPQVPGKYDIVIDFGNNASEPSLFAPDGSLDPPFDMIDGYIRVGFYVTEDPSLSGPWSGAIGQHDYALGTIQVPSSDTGPTPTDALPLSATIRYPAQNTGIDALVAAGTFPLVVVMHGNSGMETSYLGYNYLLDHLAGWGFIAMSIYAPVGAQIETRARAILAHINIMSQNQSQAGLFQGHIDITHIGIVGHSRGGEAVVRAARINSAEGLNWNLLAGVAIAPTDYFHYGNPGIPLLVIYGANDGDVSGSWPDRTGFDVYDEASRPRSFVFVYGATHDRFNTEWASIEASTELTWDITPSDLPNLITLTSHEGVAKGYVTAFLQANMQNRPEQLEFFSSGLKPTLVNGVQIHLTHQASQARVLDDFAQLNPGINTLGGTVTGTALSGLTENALRTLDAHSPHVVSGGNLVWQSTMGRYKTDLPLGSQDLSAFDVLSMRVSQKYESPRNPAGQPQDFLVRLTDAAGRSRAIQASLFASVPYPYVRGYDNLVKSAMKSVRIPLASFTIANLGAQDVDLTQVVAISLEFSATAQGDIDVGDLEFGN